MSNALDDLIAKVEAGGEMERRSFRRLAPEGPYATEDEYSHWIDVWLNAEKAYSGDLNAALALHNAVLPGWDWRAEENVNGYVSHIGPAREEFMPSIMAVSFESAARAWLLAILRAMKEGKDA